MMETQVKSTPPQYIHAAHNNGTLHPDATTPLQHVPEDAMQLQKRSFKLSLLRALKAYTASLLITGVFVPFAVSVATVVLYFSPPILFLQDFVPLLPLQSSVWYAPVYGVLLTGIVWLVVAVFGCYFATASGANMGSYAQMRTRWLQLKARLGLQEDVQGNLNEIPVAELCENVGLEIIEPYQKIALREAYAFCHGINRNLYSADAGMRWVSGSGYISTWDLIHRAEEALIEIEPVETVLRTAMHTMFAISGSAMSNSDELLDKLIQAVEDLDPLATRYFSEHQPDKSRDHLLNTLITTVKGEKDILRQIAEKLDVPMKQNNHGASENNKDDAGASIDLKLQAKARLTLREVKHTLNAFRDGIWDGLVRARNRLLGTIALTGFVTHVLLCVAILTDNVDLRTSHKDAIVAATAFYVVGAIAGLFGRFYNELSSSKGGDDYGLSLARLVATPLLSGLAGVGGVLVVALLYNKLVNPSGDAAATLGDIFGLKVTIYLLVAAIFGLTPNLIIRSLQQQAEKYVSDLKSSKGSEQKGDG